jgi:hypothetical protein
MENKIDWVIIISDGAEKIESRIVEKCDEETATIIAEKLMLKYSGGKYFYSLHKIL